MQTHVKFLRKQGIAIAVYLDQGIAADNDYQNYLENSSIVKQTLILSGFVINDEKSNLFPSKCLTWIEYTIDLNSREDDARISSFLTSFKKLTSSSSGWRKIRHFTGTRKKCMPTSLVPPSLPTILKPTNPIPPFFHTTKSDAALKCMIQF